ncbi:hypothetical protein [Microbacterium sp. AK031]|uniref:hypothetical protein n=1 Tax=Microbacterium sp. AK031 TaxID=2723076 RepID=UPI0021697758|nr:hypothetical protein [Microbacterium sp. AK031]MCS3841777.1 hypothetical protein [Microbacterium sp. AK031]
MTRFVQAADVGVIDDGIRVFAAALPDGPIVVLADIAAAVWRAAPGRDVEALAVQLIEDGICTEDDAHSDAALFTHALIDVKLLREVDD